MTNYPVIGKNFFHERWWSVIIFGIDNGGPWIMCNGSKCIYFMFISVLVHKLCLTWAFHFSLSLGSFLLSNTSNPILPWGKFVSHQFASLDGTFD